METIIIAVVGIVLMILIGSDPEPRQPSLIITPIDDTRQNNYYNNTGCLIVMMLALVLFITVTITNI